MPVITQLLTPWEYRRLKQVLRENSFFSHGDPGAIGTLKRDIKVRRRLKELSDDYQKRRCKGPNRTRLVERLGKEFGLSKRSMWRIVSRLQGQVNAPRKVVQNFVTDFGPRSP